MDLKEYFSEWRTYTPKVLQGSDPKDQWTLQYKLISKGESKRISNLSKEEVDKEAEAFSSIKQHFGDTWDSQILSTKRDLLSFCTHIGEIDNMTDGERKIQNIMELFSILNTVIGSRLMVELKACILGYDAEDKKNSVV